MFLILLPPDTRRPMPTLSLLVLLTACTHEPATKAPFDTSESDTAPVNDSDTAPDDTAPDDTAPDDTAPDDTAPDDTGVVVEPVEGLLDARDWGFTGWPGNFVDSSGAFSTERHVLTGWYALAFDVSRASLVGLGERDGSDGPESGLYADLGVLPEADVTWSVTDGGATYTATGFAGTGGDATNPSQLIDMGRFVQRVEIPEVRYDGTDAIAGTVTLSAWPRHFVLHHTVTRTGSSGPLTVTCDLSGPAFAALPETDWIDGSRAVTLSDGSGAGWTFVVPAGEGEISRAVDGGLHVERDLFAAADGAEVSLTLLAVPSEAASPEMLAMLLDPEGTVRVSAEQLDREGAGDEDWADAPWDPSLGAYRTDLHPLTDVGAPTWADWDDPSAHTWYNRHRVQVENLLDAPVSVPLAFFGDGGATFYIVGGSPLLRDDATGEPTGEPVQISKNWHETPYWYHLYSALTEPPGTSTFELTIPSSKWGEAYAVAHAQLCLVGWGRNQQWDESSIGAFGETVTYDPDLTLGRAMIDDVRPFLVDAAGQWAWTGNVGGADYLVYFDAAGVEQRLGQMRTLYELTGPNLTRVTYAGITADGAIEADLTAQLGRTDDLVRVFHHIRATFLEDVAYTRLAFFQVAADGYADNGFTRYAYGDASGVTVDADVTSSPATGYASDADRGIAMSGDEPWAFLYANTRTDGSLPENGANVGFVVRNFRADLGGVVVETPHFNVVHTSNGGYAQVAFELGIPYDPAAMVIPAGSVVEADIEFLVPPSDEETWYGEADYLLAAPSFDGPDMMVMLASGDRKSVV